MLRRATMVRLLAALVLLASLAPGRAANEDATQRLRAAILQSQPFRVDFVQQVYVDEELTLEESGVILFADRGRVKWQYLRPTSKTFILEGDRYQFYDAENNQLLRGRLRERSERLIWDLLVSEHPGGACRWDPGQRVLRLRLDGENGAQELQVSIGPDFLPLRVEQAAENEVTTVYLFRNYRRRVGLDASEFVLDLPADVEIVEGEAP